MQHGKKDKTKEENEKGMRIELEFLSSIIEIEKNGLEKRLETTHEEPLKEDLRKEIGDQKLRLDYVIFIHFLIV